MNLTISNDFATPTSGSNIQAVALYTTGDKTVLQNVRLHGFQDTLYVDSSSATAIARVYIKDSFIEGDTDFIFGRAVLVIDGGDDPLPVVAQGHRVGRALRPQHPRQQHVRLPGHPRELHRRVRRPVEQDLARPLLGSEQHDADAQRPGRDPRIDARRPHPQTAPWAAAATSGRAYSATGNRFNEYCNSGPGAGP